MLANLPAPLLTTPSRLVPLEFHNNLSSLLQAGPVSTEMSILIPKPLAHRLNYISSNYRRVRKVRGSSHDQASLFNPLTVRMCWLGFG